MGNANVLSGDEVTAVLDRQTAVMEQLASDAPLQYVLPRRQAAYDGRRRWPGRPTGRPGRTCVASWW